MSDCPRSVSAVVFDMDGLMFNTEEIYDQVGATMLEKRGHRFTQELKRKMMGRQHLEALEVLRQHCELDESAQDLVAETEALFIDLLPRRIEMMRGLAALLDMLEYRSIRKAVATSSSRRLAELALGHFNLVPRFEFVLTGDDVSRGKPDPEIYLTAAGRLGVSPESTVVLEDSINGTLAATAAGMITIAIPSQPIQDGDFAHVKWVLEGLDSPMLESVIFGDA
ncbi:MAG: HAD-IA family hydrolase [Pirellulaceae bacterium]